MKAVALVVLVSVGVGALGAGFVGGDILFDLGVGARSAGMAGVGVALPSSDALFLNPAGLAWARGVEVLSTYCNLFGAAHLGAVTVAVPGLAGAGIVLDAGTIGPGLAFRTAGALLGAALRWGAVGVGARARLLRPVAPVPGIGGALDFALLWRGPIEVGAVWESVVSRAPVPGEPWPAQLAVGVALPVDLGGLRVNLAADASDITGRAAVAVGGEIGTDGLLVRAGYGPGGVALGGTVGWGPFALDWATVLHPVLAPAFRVSFSARL